VKFRWGVMAVVLLGVIALSALVGLVGGEEEFDWDLAAVFGTAVGTTLLALATGALAFWTLQEVSATKELAALSRRDQQLRERPVVIQEDAALSFSGAAGSSPGQAHERRSRSRSPRADHGQLHRSGVPRRNPTGDPARNQARGERSRAALREVSAAVAAERRAARRISRIGNVSRPLTYRRIRDHQRPRRKLPGNLASWWRLWGHLRNAQVRFGSTARRRPRSHHLHSA
jgi:hypothetical protein